MEVAIQERVTNKNKHLPSPDFTLWPAVRPPCYSVCFLQLIICFMFTAYLKVCFTDNVILEMPDLTLCKRPLARPCHRSIHPPGQLAPKTLFILPLLT